MVRRVLHDVVQRRADEAWKLNMNGGRQMRLGFRPSRAVPIPTHLGVGVMDVVLRPTENFPKIWGSAD